MKQSIRKMKQNISKWMLLLFIINLIAMNGCAQKDVKVDKEIPMGRYI